jgi:hypothetical protein
MITSAAVGQHRNCRVDGRCAQEGFSGLGPGRSGCAGVPWAEIVTDLAAMHLCHLAGVDDWDDERPVEVLMPRSPDYAELLEAAAQLGALPTVPCWQPVAERPIRVSEPKRGDRFGHLAVRTGIHVTQIRRYEAGTYDLPLAFEATRHLTPEELRTVRELIEARALEH